jgi:copper transport protein
MRRCFITLILLLWIVVLPVSAHANLVRSEPTANARVTTSPPEIRLYFTEPLEAQFSHIDVRDVQGQVLDLPASQIDPDDAKQLVLLPGALADGVYTVAWRVVSQTDGHLTEGTFPFTVGSAMGVAESLSSLSNATIPVPSMVVRWLNVLTLAWLVGSIAFWVFIWKPTVPEGHPETERLMNEVIGFGWLVVGIASALILLLQASIVSDTGLLQGLSAVPQVLFGTRFGQLWLGRGILWLIFGVLFFVLPNRTQWTYRLLLLLTMGILVTQSLFSHASGAADAVPSVLADWLHLVAMSVWIGSLMQLIVVIDEVRQRLPILAELVARFSNLARLSVAMLVVTGAYAAWLHIGSIDGFFSTQYGLAMTVKLLLFLPLLALGAVNLLLTSRGLRAGQAVWSGRLQFLVGIEVTLATAILVAVGVMTAIAPARITLASRELAAIPAPNYGYFEMAIDGNLMIHLTIEPGTVGDNTFYVDLFDATTGEVVNDASLIRMRFEPKSADLGESELRPTLQNSGRYMAEGSNLSIADDWRIRLTVQRPNQYDSVMDFETTIGVPQTVVMPDFDPTPPKQSRGIALLLTGIGGMLVAGFVLLRMRPLRLNAFTILTLVFLAGSIVILQSGIQLLAPNPVDALDIPVITDDTPTHIIVSSTVDHPYLLTQAGTLLRPDGETWRAVDFDAPIRDVYLQNADTLWAATDNGLFRYADGEWIQESDTPTDALVSTHGYLFALGIGQIFRVPEGGIETESRLLQVPQMDSASSQLEMLGSHSHVLLNDDDVYMTSSLGLGWKWLDAPAAIQQIAIDGDGNLLAASDDSLLRWTWANEAWQTVVDLPMAQPVDAILDFNQSIYLLIEGQVLRLRQGEWQPVTLSENAYIVDMVFQYPDTLWVLDVGAERLLASTTGSDWQDMSIDVGNP